MVRVSSIPRITSHRRWESNWPQPSLKGTHMTIQQWLFSFKGRIGRRDFWIWMVTWIVAMIGDLSAAVTGLLMVLILPPTAPWWVIVIGDAFAIIVVKQLYGGLGKNFLNPALAGRAFLFSSYTAILTTWTLPSSLSKLTIDQLGAAVSSGTTIDAVTMATPLSFMKTGAALPEIYSLKAMLM